MKTRFDAVLVCLALAAFALLARWKRPDFRSSFAFRRPGAPGRGAGCARDFLGKGEAT